MLGNITNERFGYKTIIYESLNNPQQYKKNILTNTTFFIRNF